MVRACCQKVPRIVKLAQIHSHHPWKHALKVACLRITFAIDALPLLLVFPLFPAFLVKFVVFPFLTHIGILINSLTAHIQTDVI